MRYLLLVLIITVSTYAQTLEELENRYIEKATALKTDYEKKSISLAKSYVKALEVKKIEYTKKGDLDKALEIRKKIEDLKAVINKEEKDRPEPRITKTIGNGKDPFIGQWESTKWKGLIQTISLKDGVYQIHHSKSNHRSERSAIIGGKLVMEWNRGGYKHTIVIEPNKNGLTYTQYAVPYSPKIPSGKIEWDHVQMTKLKDN